ncbi:DNA-directed RNA polymerase III subunit RPC5 isoform X2 [Parasteatoda tepidariorum]|uniref:DNA-directed RNA polymerase III subunit RPC5 isoform X2 n=1 Tax=Parasteatoda tepidariorum TaxID=114398 RepID=UPI001C72080C|nr:DNA-directed RNA polymerase III subunit RPC5 [Parasteatoda tepidariorum]
MNSCEDDDTDEVVFESDVFLSKALADNLYLFQYPTKSNQATEKADEESECLAARIKPNQQKIEMEFGLNVHSNSYDKSRGEHIALNVDGKANGNNTFFNSPYMDKSVISGSKAIMNPENYALGLLKKGELHLVPFYSILELQPHCVQMDKMDSQAKKSNPEEEEEEEEAVAVTVRFGGSNADKNKQMRERSYQYYQQKNASEPWINLNYHTLGSSKAKLEFEKIICAEMYKDAVQEFMGSQDYIRNLIPDSLRLSGHTTSEKNKFLFDKPLSDQMKSILINGQLLTYPMLVKRLKSTPNINDASVELQLNQLAVLVRGCWAVKSELLYDEKYISPYTGFPRNVLINARDYMLWLFTKSSFITRQEVLSAVQIPSRDFESIATSLAVKTDRCWQFKFPDDQEFLESHPDIAERQAMKWDLRYKKLVKDLNIGMQDSSGGPSKTPFVVTPRPRQKRHSRSSQSEGDESGTDSMYGTKDYNKSKRSCAPKRNSLASPTKQGSKGKSFNFATLEISPTFLENSPPADLMAEVKEYVGDIMRTQYCMKLNEIKELVSQSHLSNIATRSDFEKLLEQALVECGAQKLKNKWPQNTVPETLYAFAKFENKLDRYRNALLDLFCSTARARMNLFVKKVEDELREIVSESDCKLLFEEYCVYKSGFYYLKGTIAPDS